MKAEDHLEKIIATLKEQPEGFIPSFLEKSLGLHGKEVSSKGEKSLKLVVILAIAFLLLLQASIVAQNFSEFLNISNSSNLDQISGFLAKNGIVENDANSTTSTTLPLEEEIVEPTSTTSTSTTLPSSEGESNAVELDTLAPSYSFFGASKEKAKVGEEVEFFAFWQDDFGLDKWVFSWNSSGSWENESYTFISSYDEETKVLTRQGWKYFKDLSYEDEVAVLSSGKIKWEKPLRIVAIPYDDGIYKINGEIDIYVTPNHKVFARIDYPIDFVRRIKDFLFGVDLKEFKFIEIEKAYELAKAGYGITFLDENLKPIYVKQISLESYKGMIYDITVPSHVILVKRFGKAVWSSNLNVLEGWSNVTKTVNSAGKIAFKFYASDLAGNWNESEVGLLEVSPEISEENVTEPKPEILQECEEKLGQQNLLAINAFVSVESVTKGNKTWKFVKVYGNVSLNESIISSNVSIVIKDPKGKIVFQDKESTDGSFLFSFEFLPKHSGTYRAEIFAETEFGNTGKILSFEILKHLKLKPKIKQEKFNYELGEKIRFEISVVDEDTNELYPNASLKVFVVDPEGNVTEVNFIEDEIEKGKYYVELDAEREFRPGLYKLKVKLNYVSPNPGEVEVEGEIEFSVGLVNINTPKSIYLPGERVKVIIGVLDSYGSRVNDADILVKIYKPSGDFVVFVYNSINDTGNITNNKDGT
ncbi:MAG: Hint domain-containing protein, partial [Candidatus Aenigmatarchaeota archaeon]